MRTICLVSALVGCAGLPVVEAVAQERPRIIDVHMHAHHAPFDLPGGAPGPCRPSPCQPQGRATATAAESFQKTMEAMDRYNIVKGFLSGADLDLVQQWASKAPGRFIASPWVMEAGKPAVDSLRRGYAAGRWGGMGEIAGQLTGLAPNDPALAPYFALAAEFDVPVSIHTAGIGPQLPGFRSALGSPLLLEDVLVRHPKLRVFVENAGYPYLDEMIAMMYQYPNLYGDLSANSGNNALSRDPEFTEGFLKRHQEKLIYGSDCNDLDGTRCQGAQTIAAIRRLAPSKAIERKLLYGNAKKLFRL